MCPACGAELDDLPGERYLCRGCGAAFLRVGIQLVRDDALNPRTKPPAIATSPRPASGVDPERSRVLGPQAPASHRPDEQLTVPICPDHDRTLVALGREQYGCDTCGRRWLRIGLVYEPVASELPVAEVLKLPAE